MQLITGSENSQDLSSIHTLIRNDVKELNQQRMLNNIYRVFSMVLVVFGLIAEMFPVFAIGIGSIIYSYINSIHFSSTEEKLFFWAKKFGLELERSSGISPCFDTGRISVPS